MREIDLERARRLGDRHLRPNLDDPLGPADPSAWNIVRITASPAICETTAGQHTLWMLTNLLARQFAVIHNLEIAVPAVALAPGVALFGAAEDLGATLLRTAELVAGTAMSVRPAGRDIEHCTVEVAVGRSEAGPAGYHVSAFGSGWSAFAGVPENAPAVIPSGRSPLGPYFAASLAAGEVFKRLRGLRAGKGRYLDALFLSLWDYEARPSWAELPEGKWLVPFVVPPFYLVGTGAVGQALAAAAAASGEMHGYATTIDREEIDAENLNRYPLATQEDLGKGKSDLTTDHLRFGGLEAYPHRGRWPDYCYDRGRPRQRADAEKLEAEYRYPLMLSCVDRNRARHAIQKFWPEYLIGGSTLGLALEVTAYDMRSPYECLMCFNKPEPPDQTIEELAAELRKLPPEQRRSRAEAVGANGEALEAYLANPRCGHLGEAEIAKFRGEAIDWSVGFVSVAAGTLLAAQLLKFAQIGRATFPEDKGNSLRFSFLNPGPRWTRHRRREDCDCAGDGRVEYEGLWGAEKRVAGPNCLSP